MSEALKLRPTPSEFPPDDTKSSDGEATYAEKRVELGDVLKKFESAGSLSEAIPQPISTRPESSESKFEKTMGFLKERSTALGEELAKFPGLAWGDLKSLGRGAGHVVMHPIETKDAIVSAAKQTKKYLKYFKESEATPKEKLEKLGSDVYKLAEKYRKLPTRYKMYFAATCLAGGGMSPLITSILTSAKIGARVASTAGLYTLFESMGEKSLKKMEDEKGVTRTSFQTWRKHGVAAAGALFLAGGGARELIVDSGHGLEMLHSMMSIAPAEAHEAARSAMPELKPQILTPEAPAAAAPEHVQHAVHHHVPHAKASIEAREKLETQFLNQWQQENPGTLPSDEQINAYIASHSGVPAVETAQAVSLSPEISSPPVEAQQTPEVPPQADASPTPAPEASQALEDVQVTPEVHADAAPPLEEVQVTPEVHSDVSPAPEQLVDATPTPEAAVPVEPTPAPAELPPLEDHGTVEAHLTPHPLVEAAPVEAPAPAEHLAEAAPLPEPSYALEHGEAFTNSHNVLVDPQRPTIYRYMQGNEKVTFVSGGGATGDGFLARMNLILNNMAADRQFWGTKIYWDASEVKMDGDALPQVGQISIDKSGIVHFDKPGFFGKLFAKKLDLPDPNQFLERVNVTPQS